MHQNLTVKPNLEATIEAAQLAELLMKVIGQTPPVYGHVEVTYLAGKLTKVEKRETFKP